MTRTLVRTAIAATAVAAGLFAGPTVLADAERPEPEVDAPVDASSDERYWACVAVDHVEIGACLANPYPDLSRYPTVPEVVEGITGVRVPGVPRP